MVCKALAVKAWEIVSRNHHADEGQEEVGTRPHLDGDVRIVLGD